MRAILTCLILLMLGSAAQAQPAGKACQGPNNRQMDFWLGEWKAYQAGSGAFDGDSRIEAEYGGCIVRENWKDSNGMVGGSFNRYDARSGHWRQTWVDSNGRQVDWVGEWKGDRMEFLNHGPNPRVVGATILHRMSFFPRPDGTVRQFFEDSGDDGKTWAPVWDLIYRKG